jgi:hypothetical protein
MQGFEVQAQLLLQNRMQACQIALLFKVRVEKINDVRRMLSAQQFGGRIAGKERNEAFELHGK